MFRVCLEQAKHVLTNKRVTKTFVPVNKHVIKRLNNNHTATKSLLYCGGRYAGMRWF